MLAKIKKIKILHKISTTAKQLHVLKFIITLFALNQLYFLK